MNAHLHFGPGRFGLGFVVPTLQAALGGEWRTILVARSNQDYVERIREDIDQDRVGRYQLQYPTLTRELVLHELHYFHDTEAVIDTVANPATSLITTSVGSSAELRRVAGVLARGLAARTSRNGNPRTIPTIIALENAPLRTSSLGETIRSSFVDLLPELSSVANMIDVVADRICPERPSVDGERIAIGVESHSEWFGRSPGSFDASCLDALNLTCVSEHRFEFLETRKLWLVNAMQIVVSLRALALGSSCLHVVFEQAESLEYLERIRRLLVRALQACAERLGIVDAEASPSAIEHYSKNALKRIERTRSDSSGRVLGIAHEDAARRVGQSERRLTRLRAPFELLRAQYTRTDFSACELQAIWELHQDCQLHGGARSLVRLLALF